MKNGKLKPIGTTTRTVMCKRLISLILAVPAVLSSGCAKSENGNNSANSTANSTSQTTPSKTDNVSIALYETKLAELQYKAQNPIMFCADSSGGIACIDHSANIVRRYSSDGEFLTELSLPENLSVKAIACGEDKVYVLGKFADKSGTVIGELGSEFKVIHETDKALGAFSGMAIAGGKIYFSVIGAERSDIEFSDGYYGYDGTVIYCLDLTSGTAEPISADNPVCFAAKDEGIMLYGCDNSGFYFANFNGQVGEKQYSTLGEISSFCPIGENVVAYGADGVIKAALTPGGVSSALANDKPYGTQPLALSDGCLIYNSVDEDNNTVIKRIQPRGHIKNLRSIDIIMSFNNQGILGSTGYALGTSVISESELALKLLSGDTDWDAAVIYSRQTVASEIAEQGIFRPLGDIAGEYLAESPEGVREVCVKDGEIWALPIETNVGAVLYNKERCAESGINFTNMTAEDFLKKSRGLCENPALRGTEVDVDWSGIVTETLLNNYINAFGIDSPQFREIAVLLHDNANTEQYPEYMRPIVSGSLPDGSVFTAPNNAKSGDFDNFLYCTATSYDEAAYMLSLCPKLSAAPIPSGGTATGYSMLLMINPHSDNPEETLRFAAELAVEKLNALKLNKNGSLEGKQQLNEIYANAEIVMGVPNELYMNDYVRYLRDEISLDDFVKEADRKLSAYLNE